MRKKREVNREKRKDKRAVRRDYASDTQSAVGRRKPKSIRDLVQNQRDKLLGRVYVEGGLSKGGYVSTQSAVGRRKPKADLSSAQKKELIREQNEAILNGEAPNEEVEVIIDETPIVSDIDTTDEKSLAPSFFEQNKQMIMIVGGLAVAGIVYFKFIKK
tara:strand:- start:399 stop:875 length:477 start_codon:yes stop_codon:yes gene_type:complete